MIYLRDITGNRMYPISFPSFANILCHPLFVMPGTFFDLQASNCNPLSLHFIYFEVVKTAQIEAITNADTIHCFHVTVQKKIMADKLTQRIGIKQSRTTKRKVKFVEASNDRHESCGHVVSHG